MPVTVVLDTNVIVNLCHIDRLRDIHRIPGVAFLVTGEVNGEVKKQKMRSALDDCFAAGHFMLHPAIVDTDVIEERARLRNIMQSGEAEALAVAGALGCYIASDERGAFRPEAVRMLGHDRVFTSAGVMMQLIRHGIMSVEEADTAKSTLQRNGYVMSFVSFSELCRDIGIVAPTA